MTAHQLPATSTSQPTGTAVPALSVRRIVRRVWQTVLGVVHGVDAGASIAHGRAVPSDHPARRRRLDHEEVERRLAELYPRS